MIEAYSAKNTFLAQGITRIPYSMFIMPTSSSFSHCLGTQEMQSFLLQNALHFLASILARLAKAFPQISNNDRRVESTPGSPCQVRRQPWP